MAFDQPTRNRLQRFVNQARDKLKAEFTRQLQNEYGLDPDSGSVAPIESLHLDDARRETARILRDTLAHYRATSPSTGAADALDRILREQAFTVLNRLAALRIAEARGLLLESLAAGYNSKGFQLYARVTGGGLGETGNAYCCYLFSVFDELALDLRVLFERFSHFGRLFPGEAVLLELLGLINDPEIAPLWAEDETIGWIYQYFNSKEERKKMRDKSAAPRNSRELAVRNQFFTPRYVVEFLTDNTLGRTWYEMTHGETRLVDQCRYLIRRPNEVFLEPGQSPPEQDTDIERNLFEQELLKQPVYVPHRSLKDPREIRVLDPACGSMHFGLYAFDLLETIYEEAWEIEQARAADVFSRSPELKPLSETYSDRSAFLRNMPRLIVEHNIHGIDIDPRAVQIAGLSLWLRAQRSLQQHAMKSAVRPQIRRSNIVCAEPMPGEESLLNEFLAKHFSATAEDRLLGQLVRRVFQDMKLAGEAGSLLTIEDMIADAVDEAKQRWIDRLKGGEQAALFPEMARPKQQSLGFEVSGITDDKFWEEAEERIYQALRAYAEAADSGGYQRRLFAEDAARGFAFIDICRKRYDVVLMNPPFGDTSLPALKVLDLILSLCGRDIGAAFVREAALRWAPGGRIGVLLSTAPWFKPVFETWREAMFFGERCRLRIASHFGGEVLDGATVNASAMILGMGAGCKNAIVYRLTREKDLESALSNCVRRTILGENLTQLSEVIPEEVCVLPGKPFCYWVSRKLRMNIAKLPPFEGHGGTVKQGIATADEARFTRGWWEPDPAQQIWMPYVKTSPYSPYWDDPTWVGLFGDGLRELLAYPNARVQGTEFFGRAGVTYPSKSVLGFNPRLHPEGCGFGHTGSVAFPKDHSALALLGFLGSKPVEYLLSLFIGDLQGKAGVHPNHYEVGTIQRLPWPGFNQAQALQLCNSAIHAVSSVRNLNQIDETTRTFFKPIIVDELSIKENATLALATERTAVLAISSQRGIADEVVTNSYGFSESDIIEMEEAFANRTPPAEGKWRVYFDHDGSDLSLEEYGNRIISWTVGAAFGRWNLLQSASDRGLCAEALVRPPLCCSPGMLQNDRGLPAKPNDVPDAYPLRISWPGILVDDQGHPEDIENRTQEALQVIWKDRAEAIEQEACEILGVPSLREYFRKPAAFFADHVTRYSKSRRQAPIYWPLSTPSGSYTLWLYYHRLDNQTLYSCVNDFLGQKLGDVSETLNQLRSSAHRTDSEKEQLEILEDFELELQNLRDELLRLAKLPWRPNLNDGVQITAAPLWRLFRLPKWQRTLKETWEALQKGDYDWAHLAMTIWPERVVPKCTKDRSLAIAHHLEDLFWVEDGDRWRALNVPADEIAQQKRRQRSEPRERVKQLLTALAEGDAAGFSPEEVRGHLREGDWDDRQVALLLYPQRVAEKCLVEPGLAERLNVALPKQRTKAALERFVKTRVTSGCADLAHQLESSLSHRSQAFGNFWSELVAGNHDEMAIALSLWPDRVIDKCAANAILAQGHGVRRFFWIQDAGETWRRREDPKVEVANEITRRRTAT